MLTCEHAGILPNQSNPPKLTPWLKAWSPGAPLSPPGGADREKEREEQTKK